MGGISIYRSFASGIKLTYAWLQSRAGPDRVDGILPLIRDTPARRVSRPSTTSARTVAGEVVTAVAVGIALLVLATASAAGLVPGLGSGTPVLTIVLVVAGLLLLGAGLYVRAALAAPPRRAPVGARRLSPPVVTMPEEDPLVPYGTRVAPTPNAETSFSSPLPVAPARARAAASNAVQRSVSVAAAQGGYYGGSSGVIPLATPGKVDGPPSRQGSPSPAARLAAGRQSASPFASPTEPEELELPAPGGAPTRTGVSSTRSGAAAWLSQVPHPPTPARGVRTEIRNCIGCSTSLGSNLNVPLCWGCGRALCSSCYWKNGPGPGLHRCPDCAMQALSKGTAARPVDRSVMATGAAPRASSMASPGYSRS